jgi:hypothetical protein
MYLHTTSREASPHHVWIVRSPVMHPQKEATSPEALSKSGDFAEAVEAARFECDPDGLHISVSR